MRLVNKHIVVTGGTTGIGFALSKALLDKGNDVLAIASSEGSIKKALAKEPRLKFYQADLSSSEARVKMMQHMDTIFPGFDVLINNAGIQRWINLKNASQDWSFYRQELKLDFDAPVHLSMLAISAFKTISEAAIINISSGLAITPGSWVPLYTAGKFGVHGFTQSLRLQLEDTHIKVFEVFPPSVNTGLGGLGNHNQGVLVDEFVPAVIEKIERDQFDVTYGTSHDRYNLTQEDKDKITLTNWHRFKNNPKFLKS
ncbi:SDR family NAD(P)-dependent oxidoreductase [Furfurilactobacillus entadae]|uniref:SDR family NAD(P)-dependent oxidoreductase n=1 Tax=Furfurilactobacillus entadae TaxID=2922307 RepID=UPI0035EC99E8